MVKIHLVKEENKKTYEKPTILKAGSFVEETLGNRETNIADLKEYYN
ncbi:keywimysin-related RiPP [Paenactinomyces guangxiensis]|uniref:Lasso RiPP family leader peptide-containing protein n=1 Tax=Paenactinomyces guangxiensis TaxID=1490290 RepID=A0A7W1WPI9_9BACL|nr:keywimysin-related RiPP [Paenactinomyces guangxiensis]MBA4493675.1 lasso RiPP family leader peptide-containing protein [Paenactinomyces guangxiensis]MBH8590962.1 lasso RiPP family leader peptide-containing protein [Paenactinomyces guangxiensis]